MNKDIAVILQQGGENFTQLVDTLNNEGSYNVEVVELAENAIDYPEGIEDKNALFDLRYCVYGTTPLSSSNKDTIDSMLRSGKGVFILGENGNQESYQRNMSIRDYVRGTIAPTVGAPEEGVGLYQDTIDNNGFYDMVVSTGSTGDTVKITTPAGISDDSLFGPAEGSTVPVFSPGLFSVNETFPGLPIAILNTGGTLSDKTTAAMFLGVSCLGPDKTGTLITWYDYQALSGNTNPPSYPGIEGFINSIASLLTDSESSTSTDDGDTDDGDAEVFSISISVAVDAADSMTAHISADITGNYDSLAIYSNGIPFSDKAVVDFRAVTQGVYTFVAKAVLLDGSEVYSNEAGVTLALDESLPRLMVVPKASPSRCNVLSDVIFSFAASETIVDSTWSINGIVIGKGQDLSYTFTEKGTYTIKLEATDAHNRVAEDYCRVSVVDRGVYDLPETIDLAVEPTLSNKEYRHLKFYGSGEFSAVRQGVSFSIDSSVDDPDPTGFRRGRGPTITFS